MVRIARFTVIALACLAAFGSLVPLTVARADTQSQLQDTRSRLAHAHAMYEAAKAREATLNGQVATFDAQLGAIGARLDEILKKEKQLGAKLDATKARLVALRAELKLKQAELVKAQKRLEAEQLVFEQRVVASYKTNDVNYLDVLLGAGSYDDLVTRLSIVRQLVGADNSLVGKLMLARQTVQSEKEAVAASEAATASAESALQKQLDRIAALRVAAQQQQSQLAAARAAKDGVLQQVAATRAGWGQQQKELQAESARLAAIIRGSGGGGTHGTGAFVWPVIGPITSPFGWRPNPFGGAPDFHPGIDIGVPSGTPIHAADSGTIIYAGSGMTGYGNAIVIDHGNGLSTLYAHQTSFAVSSGSVTRGQVIGYVGSTGYSTGPHLHFEVRLNGNPVDPMGYLP